MKRTELGTFRTLKLLRNLNVIAVGSSLAGATGAIFLRMSGNGDHGFALASACTTLVFGLVWAALLRNRRTVSGTPMRWGWLASIPLAIGNAATACGLLMMTDGGYGPSVEKFLQGALLGATFGAIIWLPALVMTMLAFGLPIAWAQKRAEKGLAGEEHGEVVIGLVCAAIAFTSLAILLDTLSTTAFAIGSFAAVGLLTGGMASAFAVRREGVRKKFVREVEAGAVEGFRVDETNEGKVLIRVTSMGSGYRVANFEEHLAVLDDKGEARRGQA